MSEIINKLKENSFNKVDKWDKKCPECNGELYSVYNWLSVVMDGNMVVYCENVQEHIFWNHPFEDRNILHLNKNASETDWTSEKDYKWVDGSWNVL